MRDPVPAPEVPRLGYRVLERRGPQDRLLVLCHGYGLPVSDLTDRLELLDPDGRWDNWRRAAYPDRWEAIGEAPVNDLVAFLRRP